VERNKNLQLIENQHNAKQELMAKEASKNAGPPTCCRTGAQQNNYGSSEPLAKKTRPTMLRKQAMRSGSKQTVNLQKLIAEQQHA